MTMVNPLQLLVLGAEKVETVANEKESIVLDNWISLSMDDELASNLLTVRSALDSVISQCTSDPNIVLSRTTDIEKFVDLITLISDQGNTSHVRYQRLDQIESSKTFFKDQPASFSSNNPVDPSSEESLEPNAKLARKDDDTASSNHFQYQQQNSNGNPNFYSNFNKMRLNNQNDQQNANFPSNNYNNHSNRASWNTRSNQLSFNQQTNMPFNNPTNSYRPQMPQPSSYTRQGPNQRFPFPHQMQESFNNGNNDANFGGHYFSNSRPQRFGQPRFMNNQQQRPNFRRN
jgi:hypothetical protein